MAVTDFGATYRHSDLTNLGAPYDDHMQYALWLTGTLAARPPAAPSRAGRFYYATDAQVLYYDPGTGWTSVQTTTSFTSTPTSNPSAYPLGEYTSVWAAVNNGPDGTITQNYVVISEATASAVVQQATETPAVPTGTERQWWRQGNGTTWGAWQRVNNSVIAGGPTTPPNGYPAGVVASAWSGLNLFPTDNASSFETSTFGYTTVSGSPTVAVSSAQAFVGSSSLSVLQAIATGTDNQVEADWTNPFARVAATPGVTYTISGYVRSSGTGRNVQVGASFRDGSGNVLTTTFSAVFDSSTAWTRLSSSLAAPAGTVWITPFVWLTRSAGTNEAHYYDALQVEVGSTATAYKLPSTGPGPSSLASVNAVTVSTTSPDGVTATQTAVEALATPTGTERYWWRQGIGTTWGGWEQAQSSVSEQALLALATPGMPVPNMRLATAVTTSGGTATRATIIPAVGAGFVALVKSVTVTNSGSNAACGFQLSGANGGHTYAYPGILRPGETLTLDTVLAVLAGEDFTITPVSADYAGAAPPSGTQLIASAAYAYAPSASVGIAKYQALGLTPTATTLFTATSRFVITQVLANSRGPSNGAVSLSVGGTGVLNQMAVPPGRPFLLDMNYPVEVGQAVAVSNVPVTGSSTLTGISTTDVYIFGYTARS